MVTIRDLGLKPYLSTWEKMKAFTLTRDEQTADELWLLEHPPVYTQGQAGKSEHILNPNLIPVVQTDRGGQVTYHGPGQLVAYVLMDIRRKHLGIRSLVSQLEQLLINLLSQLNIRAAIRCGAPGVYVDEQKIASIGLRVKNGCTYHGIALNVAMNLSPFCGINPCGFEKLQMTQISTYVPDIRMTTVCELFGEHFIAQFEH
jgi:lipoyl(octanoyl) transferase